MRQAILIRSGFSLIEVIVIIVIIGILSAIALPSYNLSIAKAQEREAVLQLMALHTANNLYAAQNGNYLDGPFDKDGINTRLNLNIIPNGMTYTYQGFTTTKSFQGRALSQRFGFTVMVKEGVLSKGTNPCCEFLTPACPSLPICT